MSSDLIERLRLGVIGSDNGAKLEHEAADRIAELEARVALYEKLEATVRTSRVYPGLGVDLILGELRDADE